eukprot:CFRG4368T1
MQSIMKLIAMACGVVVLLSPNRNAATATTVDPPPISGPSVNKIQMYTRPGSRGFFEFYNEFSCPAGFAKNMMGSLVECLSPVGIELEDFSKTFSCIEMDAVTFVTASGTCWLDVNREKISGVHITFPSGHCSLDAIGKCNGEVTSVHGITSTFA